MGCRQMNRFSCAARVVSTGCLVVAVLVLSGGCRICQDCEDLSYPAYGGAWERTIRDSGRVGSMFDPGGARASNLVSRDRPPQPDELERRRQSEEGSAGVDSGFDENDPDLFGDRDADDRDDKSSRGDGSSAERDRDFEEPAADDPLELELERRRKELEEMDLQDIRVIPGKPLPPIL